METKYLSKRNKKGGFTLVECMLAALILMIVMVGIMGFRYYTVLNAEAAENELLAARAACLLTEAWRGQDGDLSFDPLQQDFETDFEISLLEAKADAGMMGLSSLGSYQIKLDGKAFQAQLLYGKMWGLQTLRSLHVIIRWEDHRGFEHEYHLPTLSGNAA